MALSRWDTLVMKSEQTCVAYFTCPGTSPIDGCIGFSPIFMDRESAEKWADGKCEVLEIGSVEKGDNP